jgi:hypothetical protein
MKCIIIVFFSCLLSATPGMSQAPAKGPFGIEAVEFRKEPLPGSDKPWGKILISFTTQQEWTDGVALTVLALVEKKEGENAQRDILRGNVLYTNVSKGRSLGVLYIPPGTLARFGSPVVIQVNGALGEEGSATFSTKPTGKVEPNWVSQYNVRSGLLPIFQTPWVAIESAKYPDFIVP